MPTSLTEIVGAMRTAVETVVRPDGTRWRLVDTPTTDLSAAESDGHYRVLPGAPRRVGIGREGVDIQESALTVDLLALLASDPGTDEAALLDQARVVAAAVEDGEYPAGVEAIILGDIAPVGRDGAEQTLGVVRITVRAVYETALAGG